MVRSQLYIFLPNQGMIFFVFSIIEIWNNQAPLVFLTKQKESCIRDRSPRYCPEGRIPNILSSSRFVFPNLSQTLKCIDANSWRRGCKGWSRKGREREISYEKPESGDDWLTDCDHLNGSRQVDKIGKHGSRQVMAEWGPKYAFEVQT